MKDRRAAQKELNGVVGLLTLCKFLLVTVGITLSSVLYFVLTKLYGENAWQAYREFASYDTFSGVFLDITVSLVCLLIPICLYFFLSGKSFRETIPQDRPEWLQVGYGVGTTVVLGYGAAVIGQFLLSVIFMIFGAEEKLNAMLSAETIYPTHLILVPLFALFLAIMPAFLEEFAMRGIVLSATKKFGSLFSMLFNGFFFAFLHNSWTQPFFAFIIGMVLTYFTLRFKTIWIAVISHFIFNFNSVVMSLLQQNGGAYGMLFTALWLCMILVTMLGFIIAGIIIYRVKKPDLPKSEYTAKEKWGMIFRCPYVYIFVLLTIVQLVYLLLIY